MSEFLRFQPPDGPTDATLIGSHHPMGQREAGAPQAAARLEIGQQNWHGFGMTGSLTGYLAKDQVTPRHGGEYESRPNVGAGEVGERERHDNHVAAYKSRHASSSSGVFQSAAQALCARAEGFPLLRLAR